MDIQSVCKCGLWPDITQVFHDALGETELGAKGLVTGLRVDPFQSGGRLCRVVQGSALSAILMGSLDDLSLVNDGKPGEVVNRAACRLSSIKT